MKKKRKIQSIIYYILVTIIGIFMIYPLLWMIMSSFKETNTIFLTANSLIPEEFTMENYFTGWKGFAKITFGTFFKNSAIISVTATIGTVISSSLVAFGLSRCRFRGKKLLFAAVLLTMMVPSQVLMVPQYIWYHKLGWVGSYMPLIVPYCFAIQGFFVYMMYNFLESIPKELDEAAKIDGCSYFGMYRYIAVPLMVPALVTSGIFSFIWRWDDFMSALLYIDKAARYPVCLALKLFTDPASTSDYGAMFAMSVLSILPVLVIFIFFQKYLVDGIATSGLKG